MRIILKKTLAVMVICHLLLFHLNPDAIYRAFRDGNVVDVLWQATRSGSLDQYFGPPQVSAAAGSYTETNALRCSSRNAWADMDLSGIVPANAVVEMGMANRYIANELVAGIRANGSSLTRSIDLREAESAGVAFGSWMTMHVQADENAVVECFAENPDSIEFRVLGYWACSEGGCYTERFDTLNAASAATWEDENLSSYNVSAGDVVEVLAENSQAGFARYAGIRTDGSSLERRFDLNEAEAGGDSVVTMNAVAVGANATIEIYEEVTADTSFRLLGYWDDPPGTYTEAFSTIAAPAADNTWTDRDLSSAGVPANGVAEIVLANGRHEFGNSFGVRTNGSTVHRTVAIMESEDEVTDSGVYNTDTNRQTARMHVKADASSVIEIFHEDVSDTVYEFQLVGYWTPASTITISGTANGNDSATVKVAVNGSEQSGKTGTIGSNQWEITGVTEPTENDIITVWVDNVSDANESTGVTKWSSGDVSDMVLDTNVLTIGSNQNTSLTVTNLNQFDCTENEDVMHQAVSSHLKVEGDACAGSTTNSYSAEELEILSGDTLTIGTSETLTTYDMTITGTLTSSGNATYNVAHNWAKTGTFTSDTSTVNLTGPGGTTQIISGSTSFYNLSAVNSVPGGSSWYNSSWLYRDKLTIDHDYVESSAEVSDIDHETNDLTQYDGTTTDSGDLTVSSAAALGGSGYGVSATIDDGNAIYGYESVTTANAIRYRFYIDPNSLTMADGDSFSSHYTKQDGGSYSTVDVVALEYTTAGGYRLRFGWNDDAGWNGEDTCAISDAPHYVEILMQRASNSTSSDGSYEWWVDGASQGATTSLDNYNRLADYNLQMEFGMIDERDAGTSGTFYFDEIVIHADAGEIGVGLTDFPVYVDLNDLPAAFHSNVNQTDARDIRVTKSDGTTELPREVVFYTAASDTGELHFKYTGTLSGSTDTEVYIYYGNSGASDYSASDTYGKNNVWSDYKAVWHLQENASTQYDSTSNGKNATVYNATTGATGKLGSADTITASNNYLDVHSASYWDTASGDNLTVEAWINLDGDTGNTYSNIWGDTNGPCVQLHQQSAGNYTLNWYNYDTEKQGNNLSYSTSTWYHVALSKTGSTNLSWYRNGSSAGSTTPGTGSSTPSAVRIGNDSSLEWLDGTIDELRISSTNRSSTWISSGYNNQNSPGTFFNSFGTEEEGISARTIRFTAGTITTVTGTWTVTGVSGALITLESSTTSAWTINPTAASVSYVSVSYSTNTGTNICATYSTDGGNNNDSWDISASGSCNTAPGAPTTLYCNESATTAQSGVADPEGMGDSTPVFSAVYADDDTGDIADKFQVIVYSDGSCTSEVWDSGDSGTAMTNCTQGNRCSDINFGGTALALDGRTYYWKIRYWDDSSEAGSFSDCSALFTMVSPSADQMRHGNYYFNKTAERVYTW